MNLSCHSKYNTVNTNNDLLVKNYKQIESLNKQQYNIFEKINNTIFCFFNLKRVTLREQFTILDL